MRSFSARRITALLAVLALAVFAATAAASSDPTNAIIQDVAADGHVDGHYTDAQLRAALASPLLQQYGGPGGVAGVQAALGKNKKPPSSPGNSSGSAPSSSSSPSSGAPAVSASTGGHTLPFTGADIALFLVIGGVLIAAGIALRRVGRGERNRV